MANRINWDIYEATVLLNSLVDVLEGRSERSAATAYVSRALRERAVDKGMEIDELFRNVNGITLQMSVMEACYTNGKSGLKKSSYSKAFMDAVDYYKNDKEKFNSILLGENKLKDVRSVQEQFYQWLASKVSDAKLSELYFTYSDLDDFLKNKKIVTNGLFYVTSKKEVGNIVFFVRNNPSFKKNFKNRLTKMTEAVSLYDQFVADELETHNDGNNVKNNITFDDWMGQYNTSLEKQTTTERPSSINKVAQQETKPITKSLKNEKRSEFMGWLTDKDIDVARTFYIVQCIEKCGKMSIDLGITKGSLFDEPYDRLVVARDSLINTPYFKRLKTTQQKNYNSYVKALAILIKYKSFDNALNEDTTKQEIASPSTNDSVAISKDAEKYLRILELHFSEDGYQTGRAIFRGRFKRFFEEEFGESVPDYDEVFEEVLLQNGTVIDGRVFPRIGDNGSMVDTIVEDINDTLSSGVSAIYLESVFKKYSHSLAKELLIYNKEALHELILKKSKGLFIFKNSCYMKKGQIKSSDEDILKIMKDHHAPVSYEEIQNEAWYIPLDRIKTIFRSNKYFVSSGSGYYFYAPNLPVNASEIKNLIEILNATMANKAFITESELMDIVKNKCPNLHVNTQNYSNLCIRNSLGYIIRDHFSFNGPIISKKGSNISMSEAYAEFAKSHARLTLAEINNFASEMNTNIYWDSILREMIRISDAEFVRKDLINFNVDEIDNQLEQICTGDYMPLKDISLYLHFPNVGYPWNVFMLESYLHGVSKSFSLVNLSFGKDHVCGAIVRNTSNILDYHSLVIRVLCDSNILEPAAALNYLVKRGYQQRKRLDGIDDFVKEAKIAKQKIENEDE